MLTDIIYAVAVSLPVIGFMGAIYLIIELIVE